MSTFHFSKGHRSPGSHLSGTEEYSLFSFPRICEVGREDSPCKKKAVLEGRRTLFFNKQMVSIDEGVLTLKTYAQYQGGRNTKEDREAHGLCKQVVCESFPCEENSFTGWPEETCLHNSDFICKSLYLT